ncbi:hypothetical protein IT570_03765 [Candidatus Sumerlaeota bacterium]|nr:hypothetical protein [Candidatus Sumerlaeota bacterium]
MKAVVVIASPDGSPIRNRREFIAQADECGATVVAVYADGARAQAEVLSEKDGEPLLIKQPREVLTPHLWQVGIEHSEGEIIVLTLNGLAPEPGWLRAHLTAYSTPDAKLGAIGGSIEPATGSSLVDRAVALSRYSAFLPPLDRIEVRDVAADNASYLRAALGCCADLVDDGFWEPPVHERMNANGWKLELEPAAQMTHGSTNSLGGFLVQRLKHGHRFGSDRRKSVTTAWAAKYLVLSPLVPIVLALRTLDRMRAKGRGTGEWIAVLPLLIGFNVAWTLGEIWGTIAPRSTPASQMKNGTVS